jgi:hypothetical protein
MTMKQEQMVVALASELELGTTAMTMAQVQMVPLEGGPEHMVALASQLELGATAMAMVQLQMVALED